VDSLRRRTGLSAIVVVFLLAACTSGSRAPTPRPSFLQNCAPTVPEGAPALTCDQAIAAALATLDAGHPRILKVEFYYGSPCDPAALSCPVGGGDIGYVNVQMAAPDSDQFIRVVANADGSVSAGEGAAATTPAP
jgi:hypothetical protein